ncbi:MAG: lipopolysaccharide biosynthesis protein [Oxalobacteraceae bacterium]|nr:lipopolysaccharide biosynthesis protein [Oxalobacteraceae bacterium]
MQKDSFITQNRDPQVLEISLLDVLATIWRSRWMVLIVTSLVAICGVVGALYVGKYRSEGFFQFGGAIPTKEYNAGGSGITLSDYKRFAASYTTSERFAEYVQDKKLDSAAGIDDLRKAFVSRGGIAKSIEPVYPFTKLDAKNLMDQPKDSSNNVIGLQINVESANSQTAQQMVGFLGHYVMDSIVYLIYSDTLRFKQSEISAKLIRLDNSIIYNKEKLEEYRRKGADLKQILTRYPSSSNQQSQQVVSVTEDSARYLSPVTQLVTTEVQTSEANELIVKTKREQQQAILLQEYYKNAKALLESTKSGETVLRGLEPVKDRVFKDKNLDDEVVKEVYNVITMDNQNAINVYLEKSRFIAGPTLPSRSSSRPALVLAGSLIFGLFLSMILVFGRNWWRENKTKICG